MKKLNKLELTVIEMLLENNNCTNFKEQVKDIRVISREMTGVGFFTTLYTTKDFSCQKKTFKVGNVHAEINDLKYGAGFLLYIENNGLKMLEGYSYDEKWPIKITNFSLNKI